MRLQLIVSIFLLGFASAEARQTDEVAATVGDAEIFVSRVERHLARTLGNREVTAEQQNVLRKEALQHLVHRELVNHFLKLRGYEVGSSQVQLKLEILTANLDRVGKTLDDFLREKGQSKEELEREIKWEVRWERYLSKTLTHEVLQSYFQRHRREFDGTEIRVAQILFRSLDSQESIEAALELAKTKRAEILSGKTTWKTAVEQNSIAASREKGGEVGWIRYSEPMPPEFSRRTFGLEVDELAEPFASKFGVHLIKCLEVRPGKAEFGDVRKSVESAATKELFQRISSRHQSEVEVKYAEGWSLDD